MSKGKSAYRYSYGYFSFAESVHDSRIEIIIAARPPRRREALRGRWEFAKVNNKFTAAYILK
jgi:hypothetical protein